MSNIISAKRVLFEDEHYIIVFKHAGELVVADRWGKEQNILLHMTGEYLRENGHMADATKRDIYPVHRLDRETSGAVVFAKHKEAHRKISRLFANKQIQKTYLAFVQSSPNWDKCRVSVPLKRAEGKKGRGRAMISFRDGQESITDFSVVNTYEDISLIEAKPLTGKLHQIRVHMRLLGHPLIADEKYGETNWQSEAHKGLKWPRMLLHARSIEFIHPMNNQKIQVNCAFDDEFREKISYFR